MRTIVTFLNDKGLKSGTIYRWQGREYEGGVFSLALRQFVAHDRMLVCNTPEAETNTWPALAALQDPRIEPVPIPKGETTAELWQMFDAITARIGQSETVIFDITHGLRSLPFLVFLFAAYLKSAKQVKIDAIYYGALELGKPAPVIDLSEFATILDWLTATDQFVQTGDARRLAGLLNPEGRTEGRAAQAAAALSQVSLAAFLCQPFTLAQHVAGLEASLAAARPQFLAQARPFGVLAEGITRTFGAFASDGGEDPAAVLCAQLRLVEWYYANNQLIQAMTLAREWLIDAVTYRLGRPKDFSKGPRQRMEWAISGLERVGREVPSDDGTKRVSTVDDLNEYGRLIYDAWPEREEMTRLWSNLAAVRNALDHAEHQTGPMALEKISLKAEKEIMPRLRNLAQIWGLAAQPGTELTP